MTLLALAACVGEGSPRPLTVPQVMQQAQRLDGREIVVTGWIERCRRLSCPLYASADEVNKPRPYILSIGENPWFDAWARRKVRTRVTVRARFDAACVTDPAEEAIAVCSDRPATLSPVRPDRPNGP